MEVITQRSAYPLPAGGKSHHRVSRGWQQNFASTPDKRVAIIEAATGNLIADDRPIKTNWATPGFSAFLDANGNINDSLEGEWAAIERTVLNEIRGIGPARCSPTQAGAVINLVAVHLVRSDAYEVVHRRVAGEAEDDVAKDIENDAEAIAIFTRDKGRAPNAGELNGMVRASMQRAVQSRELLIESQIRQHNGIVEQLGRYFVQVITTEPGQPGFAIGDIPAVHANTRTGQFGFRDRLAVGDANLVMAPLDRHTAVFLSAQNLPPETLRKKWQVQTINAATLRAALSEVACHPDDTLELRRVARDPRRFPLSKLMDR